MNMNVGARYRMAATAPGDLPDGAASYEQLLTLARYRRTVRVIDDKRDVPDEVIGKIVEVARWAPSAGNSQPWEFLVIRDSDMRKRIGDLYAKQMRDKREIQKAVWGDSSHIGYTGFRKSPVLVLILCETRVQDAFPVRTRLEKAESHLISSMASATLLLHLAITSLGLASQWVSDVSSPYMATMLASWLNIPPYMQVYDMAGVGYAAAMPEAPPRRPLDEIIHLERYDDSKARDEAAVREFLLKCTRLGWQTGFSAAGEAVVDET